MPIWFPSCVKMTIMCPLSGKNTVMEAFGVTSCDSRCLSVSDLIEYCWYSNSKPFELCFNRDKLFVCSRKNRQRCTMKEKLYFVWWWNILLIIFWNMQSWESRVIFSPYQTKCLRLKTDRSVNKWTGFGNFRILWPISSYDKTIPVLHIKHFFIPVRIQESSHHKQKISFFVWSNV